LGKGVVGKGGRSKANQRNCGRGKALGGSFHPKNTSICEGGDKPSRHYNALGYPGGEGETCERKDRERGKRKGKKSTPARKSSSSVERGEKATIGKEKDGREAGRLGEKISSPWRGGKYGVRAVLQEPRLKKQKEGKKRGRKKEKSRGPIMAMNPKGK